MSSKNKIICQSLEDIVDPFLEQKINIKVDNPLIEGFLIKSKKQKESIIFIDSQEKNSIRCYFINNNSIEKNEKVIITKSKIDLLLVERGSKYIESNMILLIESFEIITNNQQINIKTIPLNINRVSDIKNKIISKLDEYIKQLLNKYFSSELNNLIDAGNFLNIKFQKKQINLSIFKIIQKIFKFNEPGILLNENIGLKEPFEYMIAPTDNDFDLTTNILNQVNWKNLYNNMPTVLDNKINDYKGEKINIRNLRNKNEMEKGKEEFLSRKHKRYEINENEKKLIPNQLYELIQNYGNIQVNIGQSLINKYMLYKKYMKLIHTEIIN